MRWAVELAGDRDQDATTAWSRPNTTPAAKLAKAIAGALRRCAAWHGAREVVVRQCPTPGFAEEVRVHLDREALEGRFRGA